MRFPQLRQLPTVTTRGPRPNEQEGRQHFFVTLDRYNEMITHDELIEHQEVHPGLFYGTPRFHTEQALSANELLIADIDIYGALALKAAFSDQVVTIFIKPPSLEVLEARMRKRGDVSEEELKKRLARVLLELAFADRCDYQVVNDTFEQCLAEVTEIIRRELVSAH